MPLVCCARAQRAYRAQYGVGSRTRAGMRASPRRAGDPQGACEGGKAGGAHCQRAAGDRRGGAPVLRAPVRRVPGRHVIVPAPGLGRWYVLHMLTRLRSQLHHAHELLNGRLSGSEIWHLNALMPGDSHHSDAAYDTRHALHCVPSTAACCKNSFVTGMQPTAARCWLRHCWKGRHGLTAQFSQAASCSTTWTWRAPSARPPRNSMPPASSPRSPACTLEASCTATSSQVWTASFLMGAILPYQPYQS